MDNPTRLCDVRLKQKNLSLVVSCIEHLEDPPQRPTEMRMFHYKIADHSGSAMLIVPKRYLMAQSKSFKKVALDQGSFEKGVYESEKIINQIFENTSSSTSWSDSLNIEDSKRLLPKFTSTHSNTDHFDEDDYLKDYIQPYDILKITYARAGRNKGCMVILLMDKLSMPHQYIGQIKKVGRYTLPIKISPYFSNKIEPLQKELTEKDIQEYQNEAGQTSTPFETNLFQENKIITKNLISSLPLPYTLI